MTSRTKSGQFLSPVPLSILDQKPQFLRGEVSEGTANTYAENSISTPNLAEMGIIMEILKVYTEISNNVGSAQDDGWEASVHTNEAAAIPNLGDSGVIAKVSQLTSGVAAATVINLIKEHDFTDGNGNGLLFAKKAIRIGIEGTSQSNLLSLRVAILYRLVPVTPAELVGLLAD